MYQIKSSELLHILIYLIVYYKTFSEKFQISSIKSNFYYSLILTDSYIINASCELINNLTYPKIIKKEF